VTNPAALHHDRRLTRAKDHGKEHTLARPPEALRRPEHGREDPLVNLLDVLDRQAMITRALNSGDH
jgi:hypothetical protein